MDDLLKQDMSDQFNTELSSEEMKAFANWVEKTKRLTGRNILADLYNYDLFGFYKNNPNIDMVKGSHFPDEYKKPNHPTFSKMSIYASEKYPAGIWSQTDGKWDTYTVPPERLAMIDPDHLNFYFSRNEPGAKLVLPTAQRAR